jgi:GxxExxY protein
MSDEHMHRLAHGDAVTRRIIGLAIKVHRCIGAGLLESVYEACHCHELVHDVLTIVRQAPLSLIYDGVRMDRRYRADVIVERSVIVEIKAVEHVVALHEAQMMTYMRLSGCRIGLLLIFNSIMLKDGLRRFLL